MPGAIWREWPGSRPAALPIRGWMTEHGREACSLDSAHAAAGHAPPHPDPAAMKASGDAPLPKDIGADPAAPAPAMQARPDRRVDGRGDAPTAGPPRPGAALSLVDETGPELPRPRHRLLPDALIAGCARRLGGPR